MADNEDTRTSLDGLKEKLVALLGSDANVDDILEKAAGDGLKDTGGALVLKVDDWIGYGVAKVPARQLVAQLQQDAVAANAAEAASSATTSSPGIGAMLLPQVPEDEDFLKQLQIGGIAKMKPQDVMAAVRALIANQLGLFELDERLLAAIAAQAESNDETYPEIYYDLERARSKKAHADVLKALDVPGRFVTESRKRQFLDRIGNIWSVLGDFHTMLEGWQSNWQSRMSNPGAMMASMAAMMSGGGQAAAAAGGFMDAPDTAPIVDATSGVIDKLNKMFSGPGIPVARALAADALQLRSQLEKNELIAAVGATSREEMLRKLGIGVTADVIRAERSALQFVLGVLQLTEVPDNQLPMYIVALKELGSNIPWARLQSGDASETGAGAAGKKPPMRETF